MPDEAAEEVVLNFTSAPQTVGFDFEARSARLLFLSGVRDHEPPALSRLTLAPFEVFIAALE